MQIRIQPQPFTLAAMLDGFGIGAGAIVTFSGIVRDDTGQMTALELEHYPGMTEKAVTAIAENAFDRWNLTDLAVIHRFGRLEVGETIMAVATAARHRADAFAAAEYLMDFLKSRAPFWKREISADGPGQWVAAKDADEDALARWD